MKIRKKGFVFEVAYFPATVSPLGEYGQKVLPDTPEEIEIIGAEIDTEWKAIEFLSKELYEDLLGMARKQYIEAPF